MVASLDGFIAKNDGSTSWMETKDHYPEGKTLTEQDISEFIAGIDCYVMGSKTYEHAMQLGWPYGETPVIVLTSRNLKPTRDTVELYAGDLKELVNQNLKPKYRNIWLVGGAAATSAFLQQGLADEIVISLLPVILGSGIPFFRDIQQAYELHLKAVQTYQDGIVELSYEVNRA